MRVEGEEGSTADSQSLLQCVMLLSTTLCSILWTNLKIISTACCLQDPAGPSQLPAPLQFHLTYISMITTLISNFE